MDFIEEIKQRAKKDKKTIVLPEASDIRTLEAARTVLKEDYANIILLGNEENILNMAKDNGLDLSKAKIIDPLSFAISNIFSPFPKRIIFA